MCAFIYCKLKFAFRAAMDSIHPEFIETVAQGVAGAYPLPNGAAREVAMDTEYFTRELIALALTFRAHSKSPKLSPSHVASALRVLTGRHPLGHIDANLFRPVPQCDGVYVVEDRVVPLAPYRDAPLPPEPKMSAPVAAWLHAPGRCASTPAPSDMAEMALSALNLGADTMAEAQKALREVPKLGAFAAPLAIVLSTAANEALQQADARRIARILALTNALLHNPDPGARSAVALSTLARIALSALLAPTCSQGAAQTLHFLLVAAAPHPPLRAKVLATLAAALTDANAPLYVVLGAVRGLVVAGREASQLILAPHVPALANALARILRATRKLGADNADAIEVRDMVAQIADIAADALNGMDEELTKSSWPLA